MPPRKLKLNMDGDIVSAEVKSNYKAKTRDVDNAYFYKLIAARELSINDESSNTYFQTFYNMTKETFAGLSEAEQLKAIGIKSGKTAKIYTEQEDKDNKRKHEEISLQAQFCGWVKHNYPDVKFLRHEREKARSKFMGNQMQKMNSAGSMPDWEATKTTDKYAGLFIEFKKPGEKWLLKDNETVKPKYAPQYACHIGLWNERKVVYFCNDLEIAKLILQQYLENRNMRMRVYKFPDGYKHLDPAYVAPPIF